MKLLATTLLAVAVGFAKATVNTASYQGMYDTTATKTAKYDVNADLYIKQLQHDADGMRFVLKQHEKQIDRQLRALAHDAATLRAAAKKLFRKVPATSTTAATTTPAATTTEAETTVPTSTTIGVPITVTTTPECPTCEREGMLVMLAQECPADNSKRIGEVCQCDNECDTNNSCSKSCTQSIAGMARPLQQTLREDQHCLPQQKRQLNDLCQCDDDCGQGLACFILEENEARCMIPNGSSCNLTERMEPNPSTGPQYIPVTPTPVIPLCPSMVATSALGQPCTCTADCAQGLVCLFIADEGKCVQP